MKLSSIASQTPICDGLFVARPYVDARRPAEYNHRRWYVYLRDVAATGHRIIGPYTTKGEAAYWARLYHSALGCPDCAVGKA